MIQLQDCKLPNWRGKIIDALGISVAFSLMAAAVPFILFVGACDYLRERLLQLATRGKYQPESHRHPTPRGTLCPACAVETGDRFAMQANQFKPDGRYNCTRCHGQFEKTTKTL